MKRIKKIVILVLILILGWLLSSIISVQKAKNREGIILSPKGSKSVEFIKLFGNSQLLMNFHKNLIVGGSNIVSGDFAENDIRLKWNNDNTLVIEYLKGTRLNSKEHELYFFGETVKVIYNEISSE